MDPFSSVFSYLTGTDPSEVEVFSYLTGTDPSEAEVSSYPTGTGPSQAEVSAYPTGTGPSEAEVSAYPTGTDPSEAEVSAYTTGTGPSEAEVSAYPTGTGPSEAEVSAYPTGTGPSEAEVSAYPTGTSLSEAEVFAYPPPQVGGVTGVIVDPRFCAPYPVELAIVRKMMKLRGGNFVIMDMNGNLLFKVDDLVFGLHDKRILLDGSGSPVLTLREKIMSMHHRWQVFRGGSTEQRDLLYTVKRSSMLRFKRKLDVFLSHNKEEKIRDFRVKVLKDSCVVYAGESDAIVALMHKKHTMKSFFLGKDHFSVNVYPNVDYAFIATLVSILDSNNRDDRVVRAMFSPFFL